MHTYLSGGEVSVTYDIERFKTNIYVTSGVSKGVLGCSSTPLRFRSSFSDTKLMYTANVTNHCLGKKTTKRYASYLASSIATYQLVLAWSWSPSAMKVSLLPRACAGIKQLACLSVITIKITTSRYLHGCQVSQFGWDSPGI